MSHATIAVFPLFARRTMLPDARAGGIDHYQFATVSSRPVRRLAKEGDTRSALNMYR
jgi:hypothetical protein